MNCLFCKKRTVYLYRRKSVQSLHNRLVRHLQRLINTFSFDQFCCHTACSNRSSTSKCFKFYIPNDLILIDVQINSHNIPTFGISNGSHTACILNFSYVSWILEVIHYFFCIHINTPFYYAFCFLIKSSYNGDILLKFATISLSVSTV